MFWLLVWVKYKHHCLFKAATAANPAIVQFWLSYINALIKLDRSADAQAVSVKAQQQGFTGEALDQLEKVSQNRV